MVAQKHDADAVLWPEFPEKPHYLRTRPRLVMKAGVQAVEQNHGDDGLAADFVGKSVRRDGLRQGTLG